MCGLEFFSNDRYRVLVILFKNQVTLRNQSFAPLSQDEIAEMVCFSKYKTNKLINELIDEGYVAIFENKRGKYEVTSKGIAAIEIMGMGIY